VSDVASILFDVEKSIKILLGLKMRLMKGRRGEVITYYDEKKVMHKVESI
jgi:hypothetical protein